MLKQCLCVMKPKPKLGRLLQFLLNDSKKKKMDKEMKKQNHKILLFMDQYTVHTRDTNFLKM